MTTGLHQAVVMVKAKRRPFVKDRTRLKSTMTFLIAHHATGAIMLQVVRGEDDCSELAIGLYQLFHLRKLIVII